MGHERKPRKGEAVGFVLKEVEYNEHFYEVEATEPASPFQGFL
jgi:hypothetical protein